MSDSKITGTEQTIAADAATTLDAGLATSTPSGPELVGGRYQLLELLGAGGMGSVYRVRDVELDEVVALKVLRRELVDAPGMLARFRQEVKLARRVTHRNVARTFDIGEHGGEKFLTMELIDGPSLGAVLARTGPMPVAEVVRIGLAICAGMSAAHAAGVVHRDLKPDNVLLAKDGRVVVTDFGIARAPVDAGGVAKTLGGTVGTPAYMAPEQVEASRAIDARADVYALGAVLFEALTGERAWPGDAPFAVAAARLVQPPPDPRDRRRDVPDALASIVTKAMARRPDDRFPSADALASALAAVVTAPQSERTSLRAAAPPPSVVTDRAVAVLPFRNAGAAEDDYLADGLTEDLIDTLSVTRGLRVRPRASVARFEGRDRDPREIGAELGVDLVVEGTLRRAGDALRITARLLHVADGFQLWAHRFDRRAADVLAVGDEVAEAVAEALRVDLAEQGRGAPSDPVALDLYLRARFEMRNVVESGVARAVGLLDEALARVPNDPVLLATSALAQVRLAFFGSGGADGARKRAREAAERALSLAPELGEAWTALGSVRFHSGDPEGAVRALRVAVQKSPGLAVGHELLGRILLEVDLVDQALGHLRNAIALDPSLVGIRWDMSRAHALLGEWDEAKRISSTPVESASDRASQLLWVGRMGLWRREATIDIDALPAPEADVGPLHFVRMVAALALGRAVPDEAIGLLENLAERSEEGRRRALFFQLNAEVFCFVGNHDRALRAVAGAIGSGLIDVVWMDRCPLLGPLRTSPEWTALRATVAARARRVVEAFRG